MLEHKSGSKRIQSSEELIQGILNGDSQNETEMIKRYGADLHKMLRHKSGSKAVADDVFQETWLLVLQKIRANQVKKKKCLKAFIFQIARYQLIMKFRERNKNVRRYQSTDEVLDSGPSPEQQLGNKQLAGSIARSLENLSQQRDRDILTKYYLFGDTKLELCDEFSLQNPHFDRVLYRARERFKAQWLVEI